MLLKFVSILPIIIIDKPGRAGLTISIHQPVPSDGNDQQSLYAATEFYDDHELPEWLQLLKPLIHLFAGKP